MAAALLQTPLHAWHAAHGGRMVPFAGWSMPVQYATGILAEHRAVRDSAGLFDISHMGRVAVSGADAFDLLQTTTTNNLQTLGPLRAQYSLLCHESGGTRDDVVIYRLEDHYLVVVNASNRERDVAAWRAAADAAGASVTIDDRTAALAMIALQGPAAREILQPRTPVALETLRYYAAVRTEVAGRPTLLLRSGYTGEDGFELVLSSDQVVGLWDELLSPDQSLAPVPCGLGARDTLRLEAGFALYGHELTDDVTPLEADLGRFVKLDKGPFVGAAALAAQRQAGLTRRLVGFEMLDAAVPRQGYAVTHQGDAVGVVTSGTFGPSVGHGIGMALVPPELSAIGTELAIVVRDRPAAARVVARPFWPHRTWRGPAT